MKQELEELLKLHELNQKAKFETGQDDDEFDNLPVVGAKPNLFGQRSDLDNSDIKKFVPDVGKKPALFGDRSDPFEEQVLEKAALFGRQDPFTDGFVEPTPIPRKKPGLFGGKDPFTDGFVEPEPIPLAKPKQSHKF